MPTKAALISSMTGFGRGSYATRTFAAEVELRSVNGKGLSIKLRLPNERLELEPKLEAIIRKEFARGSMQGQVRLQSLKRRASSVDHGLMRGYLKEWRALEKELGIEKKDPSLAELLAMPGAMEKAPESDADKRAAATVIKRAFAEAVESLQKARQEEGRNLKKELLRLVSGLERNLQGTERRVPQALKSNFAKLQERVQEAWTSIGVEEPMDLARELAVLADRADVQEEVARLQMHIKGLRNLIEKGGACGRELEFIIQECHREITTLANKSSDIKLADYGVKMKVLVGQLKEQVANVE